MQYYFPDLDSTTRMLMKKEVDVDIISNLVFYPKSLPEVNKSEYVRLLTKTIESGSVDSFHFGLIPLLSMKVDKNSRKTPKNIAEMVAFSEFNRYYVRALVLRALCENKVLAVYRAKEVMNERDDSKYLLQKRYFGADTLRRMIDILSDFHKVFNESNPIEFLRPNSGLSIRLL